MAQRGRRSAAALAIVRTGQVVDIPRRPAPAELTDEEAKVWNAVTASQPADWFNGSTEATLVQYCQHVIEARYNAGMIRAFKAALADAVAVPGADRVSIMMSAVPELDRLQKMQERQSRIIAGLATKMRITQQATINQRGNKIKSKKPWEF